jgi:hypothetical protein
LTSKIINMADRIRDPEDRLLAALFAAEPIADDGFSERIAGRIRRRIWVRRLALPIATVTGTAIAAGPMLRLAEAGTTLLGVLPSRWTTIPLDLLPQLPVLLTGVALLVVGMLAARMLAE